ncbi:hypothetical protein FA15DRAFT_605937 [Coprinopsis marcescibilis]|uniref:Reverse transcriptase zinc-binding domain-containing protein n=1 Tax=Coprinopsis marcescibilis TaxID=230819 RepID=A0A5C3KAB2_COPMA|nr:hypothetical protein FA15DRAFT_605937 [Coprinopsis marcescibilis]
MNPLYEQIWKLYRTRAIPRKVQAFLWKALHGAHPCRKILGKNKVDNIHSPPMLCDEHDISQYGQSAQCWH